MEAAPIVNIAVADPRVPVPSIMAVMVLVTDFFPVPLPMSAAQVAETVLFTDWRKVPKSKK